MMGKLVLYGVDLSSGPDRSAMRCSCGAFMELTSADRLLVAALMVFEVRPTNWADDDDADSVAAWSALEEALRAAGALPT